MLVVVHSHHVTVLLIYSTLLLKMLMFPICIFVTFSIYKNLVDGIIFQLAHLFVCFAAFILIKAANFCIISKDILLMICLTIHSYSVTYIGAYIDTFEIK